MPGWFKIGDPLPTTWRGRPPQMLAADTPLWFRYLDRPGQLPYKNLYYNVAMTSVDPGDIPGAPALIEMWMYNISKRIDVIAELENEVHIIEVTSRAGVRALGQIITYHDLYEYTKPLLKPATPVIVCDYADPDILWMAQNLGITVVELSPLDLQRAIQQATTLE